MRAAYYAYAIIDAAAIIICHYDVSMLPLVIMLSPPHYAVTQHTLVCRRAAMPLHYALFFAAMPPATRRLPLISRLLIRAMRRPPMARC